MVSGCSCRRAGNVRSGCLFVQSGRCVVLGDTASSYLICPNAIAKGDTCRNVAGFVTATEIWSMSLNQGSSGDTYTAS